MIDGLEADVVTLALAYDVDALFERGQLDARRLAEAAAEQQLPYTSTIVFLVRKGNPKEIKDWDDLVQAGRRGDHAEPEDLRRRALELPRGLGLRARASTAATRRRRKAFVAAIYKNVPVLDTGARGSTTTFVERGIGDVLIAWENEALLALEGARQGQVRDRRAVGQHPRRAAGRGGRQGRAPQRARREVAEAYLEYLYSPEAQEIDRRSTTTGRATRRVPAKYAAQFPKLELFTIDEVFGGWKKAQATHFADGGIFDQIYAAGTLRPRWRRARTTIVLPGFGLDARLHDRCTWPARADPARGAVPRSRRRSSLARVLGGGRRRRARSPRTGSRSARRSPRRWSTPCFGLLVAWVLVRYRFPGTRVVDALVDLPFALPTAVAGIALTTLLREERLDRPLARAARHQGRLHAARHRVALTFIGLPFVVRTVQPVLAGSRARGRGGGGEPRREPRCRPSARVLFPALLPALVTGFALAFARALGEYGSVVFISGNMPMKTEIAPLLIMTKLEQYDYAGATAIARGACWWRRSRCCSAINALQRSAPALAGAEARMTRRRSTGRCRAAPSARARRSRGPAVAARRADRRRARLPRRCSSCCRSSPCSRGVLEGRRRLLRRDHRPDALAAIRLTLLVAAIAVPLNAVFGVAAAWAIAQFDFRGKSAADHADRPAVRGVAGDLGPGLRAAVRRAGLFGPWLDRARHQDHLRGARASCSRRPSSPSRSSRAS